MIVVAITRYAPTPSGYLHAGNLVNFTFTRDLAMEVGADIALRIDDADAARYRREYVDDIFETLRVHGLEWHIGPHDTDDFERRWSQRHKTEAYRRVLRDLVDEMDTYACACSRTVQRAVPTGGCAGGCRALHLPLEPERTALRVVVSADTCIEVSGVTVDLSAEMGDFVVWRRDDLPAYQLVSVVEDRDLGTTHIVRGEDLLASSAAQIWLARGLGAANVAHATYVHHPLVLDAAGRKLSKSQTAPKEQA